MLSLSSPQVMQETALRWKQEGKRLALVPTMGALHEGHLALVRAARSLADKVVVSIFVNPLQFGPSEDFARYPRSFEQDSNKLEELGVDVLFSPSDKEFYPDGFVTRVSVSQLTENLCGKFRPGHFEGVATVCIKLFNTTQADVAVFGEKDFQQLRVLQQLSADLNLPLGIIPHPTIRDADGLALSSRNRYLSDTQRNAALRIPKATAAALEATQSPTATVAQVLMAASHWLESPDTRIQYLDVVSETNLVPVSPETPISTILLPRLCLAIWVGPTRLIDNVELVRRTLLLDSPERQV